MSSRLTTRGVDGPLFFDRGWTLPLCRDLLQLDIDHTVDQRCTGEWSCLTGPFIVGHAGAAAESAQEAVRPRRPVAGDSAAAAKSGARRGIIQLACHRLIDCDQPSRHLSEGEEDACLVALGMEPYGTDGNLIYQEGPGDSPF